MRLIDADALIENKFKNPISYNAFVSLVKRQSTVDAVQVVRCAACRHWGVKKGDCVGGYRKCALSGAWHFSEFYCYDGEMRTE